MQIQEFGQTPKQLFTTPHPCRNVVPGAGTSAGTSAGGASGSGKGSPETAAEEVTDLCFCIYRNIVVYRVLEPCLEQ